MGKVRAVMGRWIKGRVSEARISSAVGRPRWVREGRCCGGLRGGLDRSIEDTIVHESLGRGRWNGSGNEGVLLGAVSPGGGLLTVWRVGFWCRSMLGGLNGTVSGLCSASLFNGFSG